MIASLAVRTFLIVVALLCGCSFAQTVGVRRVDAGPGGGDGGPADAETDAADGAPIDAIAAPPVFRFAAGGSHSCAIRADRSLWCWGANEHSQLGDGTTIDRPTPVRLDAMTAARSVAAGWQHSCAVLDDRGVWCWGDNSYGQVGRLRSIAQVQPTPWRIEELTGVDQVVAGSVHACALLHGEVWCWGGFDFAMGDLGPLRVSLPHRARAIASAGGSHTCAVLDDGTAWCWGNNSFRQLGGLGSGGRMPRDVALTQVQAVAAGIAHSCATVRDGALWCWGDDGFGQLGRPAPDAGAGTGLDPAEVPDVTSPLSVFAGGSVTCTISADRQLRCWGSAQFGQLGDGTTRSRSTPAAVDVGAEPLEVALGQRHGCARVGDDAFSCWGSGYFGEVGNGGVYYRAAPAPVSTPADLERFAAGSAHTCARRPDGSVWCWGDSTSSQAGDPRTPKFVPTVVAGITSVDQLAAGALHTCALRSDGSAACWGRGTEGQLGNGTMVANTGTPQAVAGLPTSDRLWTGGYHGCARTSLAELYCWGDGRSGQLGLGISGGMLFRPTAVIVPGIRDVADVALGRTHSCSVDRAGALSCWGDNGLGQLGDGTSFSRSSPVVIATMGSVQRIAAGGDHTCAVLTDGSAWCWGDNTNGQLGLGTVGVRFSRISPTRVTGLPGVTAIAAGGSNTCARAIDEALWCWGANRHGQLGRGDTAASGTPMRVAGLAGVTEFSVGGAHVCARTSAGASCWGRHFDGELGVGPWRDRHATPALVRWP